MGLETLSLKSCNYSLDYILYRPRSSSFKPSSQPRNCSAVGPSGGPVVFSRYLAPHESRGKFIHPAPE
jgi:hypothetical protein